MNYRGYTILAEVTEANFWTLDDDGNLQDRAQDGAGFDVTGYEFTNSETDDYFFLAQSESDREELESQVDSRLLELKEKA